MFCSQCGQENKNESKFCLDCGNSLSNSPPPLTSEHIEPKAPSKAAVTADSSQKADTLLAAFVGDKYQNYFRNKWFKDRQPNIDTEQGTNIQSFNIAAFMLGIGWMCYRKMYQEAFLIVVAITLMDLVLMRVVAATTYEKFGNTVFMIVPVVLFGLFGNYLYLRHSIQQIKKTKSSLSDQTALQQQLATQGGTTWLGAIVGTILLFATMGCMYYFLAPSWFWEVP